MHRGLFCLLALCLILGIGLLGCADDEESAVLPDAIPKATCKDCHTSETMLRATVVPDDPGGHEDEGEG